MKRDYTLLIAAAYYTFSAEEFIGRDFFHLLQHKEHLINHRFRPRTRLRTHNQKITEAAMQMALKTVWAQRSYRMAMRRQSLRRPNRRSMRLRLL